MLSLINTHYVFGEYMQKLAFVSSLNKAAALLVMRERPHAFHYFTARWRTAMTKSHCLW
jgi:hypothetical protein